MCDSLPKYDATTAFGRQFMKEIFSTVKKHLIGNHLFYKNNIEIDKKQLND
jgi:hypothetical protein